MFSTTRHLMWLAVAALAACAALVASPGAGAQTPPAPLGVTALTGPAGSDLYVTAPAGITVLERVHVRVGETEDPEEEARVLNLKDVAVTGGVATIDLRGEPAGEPVHVDAHVRVGDTARTDVHRGETTIRLRPDLTVVSVEVFRPCATSATGCLTRQTLTTQPVDVVAVVRELNGQTGAVAEARLMLGPTPAAAAVPVSVAAGDDVTVRFEDVPLTTATTAELAVALVDAAPFETDGSNNTRSATVEVTEHELASADDPESILVQALGGYGAQFNQHVYAAVTPKPPDSLDDLEAKVKALEPQLVRIFFHEVQERNADQLASFYKTVELAQASGAAINITYHTAVNAKLNPDLYMRTFADVLETLVRTNGLSNVRWVTIQNEPNTTLVTLQQYHDLYRELHEELVARDLRDQILLMGGDLVENGGNVPLPNHIPWWTYMAEHMNELLDAYSVHIYWNYWDLARMQFRLRSVREIVDGPLLEGARKPLYVTEYGVRGILNLTGLPAVQPGYFQDGTPLSRTNIAAFQHLWFDVASAQLGYSGTIKWDAYWGRYTAGYRETYNLIGPPEEGWPLFPAYHALRLLFQTTARGWQAVRVDPWSEDDWRVGVADQPEKELVGYSGQAGALTIVGLDSHGRALNGMSTAPAAEYSLGGLPPNTSFTLAVWNAAGDGTNSIAGVVPTNDAGVARFTVPLHAAFSLTTLPTS
jgi:hypothetical protein